MNSRPRALALARELSDAHHTQGVYAFVDMDTARAFKSWRPRCDCGPKDAEALMTLGHLEWNIRGPESPGIAHVERE